MRAAVLFDYDAAGGFALADMPQPAPRAGDLLIEVAAASVNPVDWKVRDGMLRDIIPLPLPAILGGDISGIVVEANSGTGFAVGDPVHAMTDRCGGYACGAFAEYASVPAAQVARKPRALDLADAAGVPLAALTAWQALFDVGRLEAGQRVLIHAAAGGVGSFAVQFARHAGARVIGTASAANLDYVLGLGAEQALDYRAAPFEEGLSGLDLVIDLVGGETQTRSMRVLRPGGVLVNAWGKLAEAEAVAAGVIARKVAVTPNGAQLRRIGELIDAGMVRLEIAGRFPLDRIEEALDLSRQGHARGKILVDVAA